MHAEVKKLAWGSGNSNESSNVSNSIRLVVGAAINAAMYSNEQHVIVQAGANSSSAVGDIVYQSLA